MHYQQKLINFFCEFYKSHNYRPTQYYLICLNFAKQKNKQQKQQNSKNSKFTRGGVWGANAQVKLLKGGVGTLKSSYPSIYRVLFIYLQHLEEYSIILEYQCFEKLKKNHLCTTLLFQCINKNVFFTNYVQLIKIQIKLLVFEWMLKLQVHKKLIC